MYSARSMYILSILVLVTMIEFQEVHAGWKTARGCLGANFSSLIATWAAQFRGNQLQRYTDVKSGYHQKDLGSFKTFTVNLLNECINGLANTNYPKSSILTNINDCCLRIRSADECDGYQDAQIPIWSDLKTIYINAGGSETSFISNC